MDSPKQFLDRETGRVPTTCKINSVQQDIKRCCCSIFLQTTTQDNLVRGIVHLPLDSVYLLLSWFAVVERKMYAVAALYFD